MGCVVKGGFTPKMILEDVCCSNNSSSSPHVVSSNVVGGAGEDFFVDELLNLNNEETHEEEKEVEQVEETLVSQQQQQLQKDCLFYVHNKHEHVEDNVHVPFLDVPAEEADLWLSQFVEESFSQFSTPFPPGYEKYKPKFQPKLQPKPMSPSFVINKSRRSKRARTGGRVWPTSFSESSTTSSTPSSPSSTAPSSPCSSGGPVKKLQKRKEGGPTRRCSHCGVQKTPQWRAGPNGAKTLCNACGVRYKSGRLYPEYRPACSPTFSSELHSNSHRKVLEMRKKKEGDFTVIGRPNTVSSFG